VLSLAGCAKFGKQRTMHRPHESATRGRWSRWQRHRDRCRVLIGRNGGCRRDGRWRSRRDRR
jgi:hypothetical protein